MDVETKQGWWRRSWTFPASVLLHVLIVGVFYLQWPESIEAPAEPESVSVELVEPPKEEPPPPPQKEEAKEPPPKPDAPPAEEKPEQPPPPSPPLQATLPTIAIRPEETQLDKRDEPGKQEEAGGAEMPEKPVEEKAAEDVKPPEDAVKNEEPPKETSSLAATSDEGEVPAAKTPEPDNLETVAVPTPKPETPPKTEAAAEAKPSGAGDPKLKPARKVLSDATLSSPMVRQMLGDLPPRRRIVQICSTEALAQIMEVRSGQSQPEGLVPYSEKGGMIGGNTLNATGGAFNVGRDWYAINFHCEVDVDKFAVTDFRYDIGPKLSEDEARKRGYPVR